MFACYFILPEILEYVYSFLRNLLYLIYNSDVYCGVDSTDIKVIHLAIQRGNKLKIDSNGRFFDESGRWIADGMKREIAKKSLKGART